ncbi:NAD-glutamate dehydrogenase [Aurantivibrio infirmus]
MKSNTVDVSSTEDLLAQSSAYFAEKLQNKVPPHFPRFVEQFFHQYPVDELYGKRWDDIFACVYGLWQFIQDHQVNQAKINVFNPNVEEHGWVSSHTVVAILQEDMPFLVDSIRMEFNRRNIAIHTIKSTLLSVNRDAKNQLVELGKNTRANEKDFSKESLIFFEIDLHTAKDEIVELSRSLQAILDEVKAAVAAYRPLMSRAEDCIKNLEFAQKKAKTSRVSRSQEFIRWMIDGHFTFLGYSEFDVTSKDGVKLLIENSKVRLGVCALSKDDEEKIPLDKNYPGFSEYFSNHRSIIFAKASERSRVHRAAYPDYVVIKRFNEKGEVCGESRFIGLYTSPVYNRSPSSFPIIREKIDYVIEKSGFESSGHDGKALRQILETFPRDELFQSTREQLYKVAVKIAQINERDQVRLFMRRGPFGKFVSCVLYVPRDLFSTAVREKVQAIISESIGASEQEFNTYFSESILARVHLVFKVGAGCVADYDVDKLEKKIVDVVRSWEDHLASCLIENLGEETGVRYFSQFRNGFSYGYRETFDARSAVYDIQHITSLCEDKDIAMNFYQPVGVESGSVRFKIFRAHDPVELSDVIPLLENLGLRVIGEHPYKIKRELKGETITIWLHDFDLKFGLPVNIDVGSARNYFQEAFAAVWNKKADSDEFNRLVLGARLNWREVVALRAYAAYMKQTAFNFSQSYIANTLAQHLDITRNLIALFKAKFDPRIDHKSNKNPERLERLNNKILESLDSVDNLNEDRIVRRYLDLINGTLRTNFFQSDDGNAAKSYLSMKFSPRQIPDIPEPRPLFEIFVYSPRVEGVHLRASDVARGGLRWSDRLEDYRTEVLGLVKAQHVKNAVIVPGGAKGGFVAKQMSPQFSRDEMLAEGIACYKIFIRGLLDITDNLIDNKIVPPEKVVRVDSDDPYLVVAADKGTATFSDIANSISIEYKHWLGDAFASGGSQGYDHKGMGITAKGAWVGVQRHFKELGVNIQKEDFSVIGIGDMAGDVFGNGMLLSEHICLRAAFNHMHIFIDPSPDSGKSFLERKRLFELPKSSWTDYDEKLISKGGGIFLRSAKSIKLTPEIRKVFDIEETELTPSALIHALLKAPVDLMWNGGIGTYVKAKSESHADVGDKASDALRVNGEELRCRVFGEGGNLGLTQLGRVEFCLNGGACNTDFIDNSAGVDCSDHEVNIKILLNELVANGDLTEKQRNILLADMTENVSELVLANNYQQTQSLSIAAFQSQQRMGEYRRFISMLESEGRLKRKLEFIPDEDALNERQASNLGLARPELSVLLSYSKVMLKEKLVASSLPDDPYIMQALERPFPARLLKKYKKPIYQHRLKREIVATQVANDIVNNMGITFCHRLSESVGVDYSQVAIAYVAARDIFQLAEYRKKVEALDHKVSAETQFSLMLNMMRKVRRGTRWILRNRRSNCDTASIIKEFSPVIKEISKFLPKFIQGDVKQQWDDEFNRLTQAGIPDDIAREASMPSNLYGGLGMVEAVLQSNSDVEKVVESYYTLGDKIGLQWFADTISEVKVESFWQAMARESYMDDLESQIRLLAVTTIRLAGKKHSIENTVGQWMEQQSVLVNRWKSMVTELQSSASTDFAMFSVALRELLDLVQASHHSETFISDENKDEPVSIVKAVGDV